MVAALLAELAQPLEFEPASEPEKNTGTKQELSPALVEPLTPRELEVLHLIATGLTNQQISDELIISVGTAKFYTSQIYSKLSVSSRTQAIARARELDLLA
jgi:LuxR family maltose regulon positive regulatory protein